MRNMKTYAHRDSLSLLIKMIYCLFAIFLSTSMVNAQEDTIEVSSGWNMVGSLYNGSAMVIIRSEPSGIISSPFYRYNPEIGYESSDTLRKGIGYWVKVSDDGLIIFGQWMGTPCPGLATVEWAGKIYNTVKIGTQCWLKENLVVGTWINSDQDASDNGTIEKYCYNNDTLNCQIYGGLYQWNEAMQYTTIPGARGICPSGWHIPTFAEFEDLSTTVAGDGNALKAIGQGTGNGAGTNVSGFSGMLAGYWWDYGGIFGDLSNLGRYWSSTEFSGTNSYYMYLIYNYWTIGLPNLDKRYGFSIRCIKD